MVSGLRALRGSILFICCFLGLLATTPAQAQYWQCVTFARAASGIELYGNAYTWWGQADGVYERGHTPRPGSVMVMKPGHGMRVGHVAMVSEIVDARTVKLTHANWSVRGGVEHDVLAVDVSDEGDWSKVRVWWAPIHDLGSTTYDAYGFIYPNAPSSAEAPAVTAKADSANAPA
ncbi:MAG TPA: CHAP domain-containing protein [Sphingomonadaceae bacterium]|nr:CHAP domain-containing protein [Sphingomonadaceae bacterium]